jgi:hypothetical protein
LRERIAMNDSCQPKAHRRPYQFTLRTLLIAVAVFSLLLGLTVPIVKMNVALREYFSFVQQTRSKIESLSLSRPPNIPPGQWQEAVDSTSNVIGQIYFYPDHGGLESLKRLCKELDEKISGQVDLTTLQWVWNECEKAEGRGQVYAVRFRDVRLLTGGPITDDRLPGLWSLDKCLWLDLSNTQVTDAGLEHLRGRTNLRRLHLVNTQVTPEGVKRLQEALPKCEILY